MHISTSTRRTYHTNAVAEKSAGWGGIFGGSDQSFRGLMMEDLVQADMAWLDKVIQEVGKEEVRMSLYVCV